MWIKATSTVILFVGTMPIALLESSDWGFCWCKKPHIEQELRVLSQYELIFSLFLTMCLLKEKLWDKQNPKWIISYGLLCVDWTNINNGVVYGDDWHKCYALIPKILNHIGVKDLESIFSHETCFKGKIMRLVKVKNDNISRLATCLSSI